MSHITTCASKIAITNETWIKSAIALMGKTECIGIRFEQKTPDLIQVRYAPIEGYQTKGNLRFIKNPDNSWSMQLDTWLCDAEIARVKKSFETNYQKAGILAWNKSRGYTVSSQTVKSGSKNIERVIATRYR